MAINGVPVGGVGVFKVTWNGGVNGATSWTASDPSVGLVLEGSDPTGQTVQVSVPAGSTLANVGLVATVTSASGSVITASASVPVLPVVVPPATSGVIDQVS